MKNVCKAFKKNELFKNHPSFLTLVIEKIDDGGAN